MRWIAKLRLRIRSLLRSDRVDEELDEELRYHLARLVDQHVAAGISPQEAHQLARREMGPLQQQKERCRDARGLVLIDNICLDFGYAVRAARKAPGFTTVAVLSLALGIGANTTIFTFVNAELLRSLPYPASDRLVIVRERPLQSVETVAVHPANYLAWRARARSFGAMALVQTPPLNVLGRDGAEQITRAQVTSDLFRVFGVAPILGRAFTEEEMQLGGPDVVILGHAFWQRWFDGDSTILGRRLAVPDGSLTIVGVAPPGLHVGPTESDAYTPLRIDPSNPGAIGSRAFQCYARLKPGVTVDVARAEMTVIASDLARQYRFDDGMGVFVSGLHDYLVTESRPALRLLMAVVAAVLVIACVNLAALLMAGGLTRRSEFALRAALGASRWRLMGQLAIESLVVALCGGVAGVLCALLAMRALVTLSAKTLSFANTGQISLDWRAVLFACVVSTMTALVFGLAPALQAGHVDPGAALRERGVTSHPRQHRVRSVLVVAEVALAVLLLVGAGLLLRTFSNLLRVPLGFDPAHTVTMNVFLGVRPPSVRVAIVDQILDRLEALPGVKAAGTIQFLPLTGMQCGTSAWLDGQPSRDTSRAAATDCSMVSRGYFAAMGIPLLQGRAFERRDTLTSSRVLIVNDSFAHRYFPDGRVLGRRILVQGSNQAPADIVGVVADVRHNGLTAEPNPTVFLLHAQTPGYITNLVVRTEGDPGVQAAAIRRAIHEVDTTQAVSSVKTMDQYVDDVLARPRLVAVVVTCFALIALLLAVIGVYGLVAYVVTQRTPEIGIRLALGATRSGVFVQQLRYGGALVGAGLLIGAVTAVALGRMLSVFLFGVTFDDPVTYGLATTIFLAVALAAVTIPARRAASIEPLSALRCE